ncbi:MAG: lipid A deacylase LpxR family protein [Burkholderiales bacterium]|nr:lipid A deacylase LpxR family protein [Burkholderiales bacterium]
MNRRLALRHPAARALAVAATGSRTSVVLGALAFAAASCLPLLAPAAEEPPRRLECNAATACEFQLYIENDSFGRGTDRYYTNGLKLGGGFNADQLVETLLQGPARSVLERVSEHLCEVHLGLFLGQNMYTPRRIAISQPQPNDRPWAGWLYLGGVAQGVSGNRLHTVELDLGMIGPAALGRQVQTRWHGLVGADRPQGWDQQLRNEPGLLLAYLQKRRYGPVTGVQVVPHFGVTAGNVMTLVRAGGLVRFGHNMAGFGPDTIEPGGSMLQRTRLSDLQAMGGGHEWSVFAGYDARLVGHNIFLDGNSLRDGPSVTRRTFVSDFTAGLSVRVAPLRISVTRVRRSEEFATPAGGGGKQRFLSINLGWEF